MLFRKLLVGAWLIELSRACINGHVLAAESDLNR